VAKSFPALPTLRFPLDEPQVQALQQFMFEIRKYLGGNISPADIGVQYRTVTIQQPNNAAPAVVPDPPLRTRPIGVELVDLRMGTTTTVSASLAGSLQWDWQGGAVLLPQFQDSVNTTRWHLTLRITEGVS
jgi:hypothetical protein